MAGKSPPSPLFIAFLAISIFALSPAPVRSLRFDLQSGNSKCISEEIALHAMAVGKYTVINPLDDSHPLPETHRVTVKVASPYGNSMHYAENVDKGNFAFTSSEAGDYLACFNVVNMKPSITVTVEFEWRTGVAAKDWANVAKKGKIDDMGMELKKLEDTVKSIHDEIFYLREREEQMQDINMSTHDWFNWLSLLSLLVCAAVAALQIWHLKTFFERKKLL